jgi:hypothetical protein
MIISLNVGFALKRPQINVSPFSGLTSMSMKSGSVRDFSPATAEMCGTS